MATGGYLVFGILMLIIVPVVMGAIGASFGDDDVAVRGDVSGQVSDESPMLWISRFFKGLSYVPFIGTIFELLGNIFLGYSYLPMWINFILTAIPILLIARGVISTSG